MSSSESREVSRDRELVRHSHSFSSDRMIPMWDSADPDRAPPPLPINPGSPNLTTRPNTSAAIMQAAKALEEKARESLPASSYTTNPMPQKLTSTERSLIKGTTHKRMQSLQPGSVRDLRSYLDNRSPERPFLDRSPERSPDRDRPSSRGGRPISRDFERDYFGKDTTPSPAPRFEIKDTPALRPSNRAILGENTPPSATMMALQTMSIPQHLLDPPLSNVTKDTARTPPRSPPVPTPASAPVHGPPPPHSFDNISSQLLSINNIVSSLQKDMSQLSRRSKDNATDLISLKEATNTRDEDIRKSLKDLLSTMSQKQQAAANAAINADTSRSSSLNLQDPHMTPTKQFTFPRMTSTSPWADERIGSPNPYSVEGAASVAMLEKIIREMVTKDGQERLVASLQKLVDKATGETAKKVAELAEFVKQGSMVHPPGSASFQPSPGSGALTRTLSADSKAAYASPKAADFVSEEMLKFLRKIKDSVAESGCVTMATKTLVQELRDEVLGMGRELARKVEEAEQARATEAESGQATADINAIVQEGLANLKEHMDKVMRERRRQSMSSVVTRNTVDNNEVYDVVKQALAERGLDQPSAQAALDKEAIISAVREAYDGVELNPSIEVQQVGLGSDEILQCLREGLQDFNGSGAVTKEEIETMLHESLEKIQLPPPINEVHEIREEILMAVRDSLEELKPALSTQPPADALSRELLEEVIRNALSEHGSAPVNLELPPETIGDAVRAATESHNEAVMQRLQSILDDTHARFEGISSDRGQDTEQVLTALREGLESLRTELQGSVNQPREITQDGEMIDHIKTELDKLREDVQGYVAEGPRGDQAWSRGDMVAYLKSEFENLHEKLSTQFLPSAKGNEEILAALTAGFEEMKSQVALRAEDDTDSTDDISEAIKHEFDQLKEVVLGDTSSNKNDILEKLQAGFDGLHTLIAEKESANTPNDAMLASLKEEFENLKESLSGSLVQSGATADKDSIVDAVRELLEGLNTSQEATSKDNLALIRTELESLRESFGNALVPAGDKDKTEMVMVMKTALDEIKANLTSAGLNEEILEAFRGELEQLRHSDDLTRQHSRADTEEVLEALKLGLDDLQSHLDKKLETNPDRQMSATGEIIDAMNEGIEGLRADVVKMAEKPVDMSVSHEILETLKEGLNALREDIDMLKGTRQEVAVEEDGAPAGNEVALAGVPDSEESTSREVIEEASQEEPPQLQPAQSADLAKMELILTQIQEKVDAMDANMQTSTAAAAAPSEAVAATGSAMKEDLVAIEELLKDVQAAVLLMQDRETSPPALEGFAKKEDTDAIETLLANTKAKIEELVLPDPATAVTKENLEDVELVVRTTSEALEALAKKFEDEGATKADVTVIQVIADDIKLALDEMKAAKPEDEANPQATKADIDAVTLLVDDLKVKLDDLKIPDPEELASKAEMEQLTGLIHDFRDSHEKMKDTYEADILRTAGNFDARKAEATQIVEDITGVKTALDEMRDEIKTNLIEGGPIENLQASFKALEETIGASNVTADVKELMEILTREFERAHGSIAGMQNEHSEKSALYLEKHDEVKDAIVADFTERLEDKFNTLMAKYDDAQLLADELAKVMKEKAEEQEKMLENTKTTADELRLTIDTLGATIAGMNDRFEGVTTQFSTDSTTVIGKVDETLTKFEEQKLATLEKLEEQKLETIAKLEEQKLETIAKFEEQKLDDKGEHSHTRDEIKNIETIFTSLQDNVTEYHPKFMVALHEIEALVKAHYEHAQKSKEEADENARAWTEEAKARSEELQAHFENLPKLLPAPPPAIELPEKYDDAPVQEKLDKLLAIEAPPSYDDGAVQEKLDKLLAIEPAPNYDDGAVHEKLDKLLGHADEAGKAIGNLEKLDEIHAQVKVTATELSEFVAKQTQFITDGNDAKEREAEELALLIERRTTQKEQLEVDLESLRAEKATQKEQLFTDLQEMKAEKDRVVQELKEEKERVMAELQEEKERTMLELKEEKDQLLAAVASLQAERENLANQKVRLTGEVSSLHTALEIRREELHFMDTKADALERRILNGIMDHSRALMMTKGGSKLKKRMNADAADEDSKAMPPPSTAANGLSLALKPRPAIRRPGAPANPAQRRILSLSQISGNAPTGAQAYPTTHTATNGNNAIKRSHSVKTSNYSRKGSWGTRPNAAAANKENDVLPEEDEHEASAPLSHSIIEEDIQSETGTERRYSIGSRYDENDADGETPGYDGRSSYGGTGSEYTYASGSSYMTGSDIDHDRRTSYGARSTQSAARGEEPIDEGSEYSEDEEPTAIIEPSDVNASEISTATADSEVDLPTESDIVRAVDAVREEMKDSYAPPSDSGLGIDLPTADLGNSALVDADYFRRAAEEEASTVG
ncbi:Rabaptin multi-domain protein [Pyrenophora tritici-repentis]|uniref:Rabaptin multi-domain protein n=2 Tax=Pyrenophora tritici-repentis TaxID=45151 RepID=A0A922NLM1_9PLEO|nr:Rabaptin multi-domain protein [Pyrenophora tritici-repentis]KAI1673714.1 Rabaptin multi-domain protein [Pyrenophora tritici-repentis]KAI1689212.1 Rabaptin multi-domain protein [Pyrenophora tritici-repentis]